MKPAAKPIRPHACVQVRLHVRTALNAFPRALVFLTLCSAIIIDPALADEGMWTFHAPPIAQVKSRYGFELTTTFLEKARSASVRFGSSSSMVSSNGLILTNHHVALGCVQRLSTADNDLVVNGFYAPTNAQERTCPGAEVTQLVSFEEVTATVAIEATAQRRHAAIANIEMRCREQTKLRCEVVTMFRGGQYWLYRYKLWQDVRLVFAPERALGFFGGDTDNFVYPRFNLDVSFVRVYENGKPITSADFLRFSKQGVADGEMVFAIGNPGSTERALTAAELAYHRDQGYPIRLNNIEDRRTALNQFGKASLESRRRAEQPLFGVENTRKVLGGEAKALGIERLFQRKRADESELKTRVANLLARGEFSPFREIKLHDGSIARDPWTALAHASALQHNHAFEAAAMEYPRGTLLHLAHEIVAVAEEGKRPEAQRLRGFRDNDLAKLKRAINADRPIYLDLEEARLAQKIDEAMGYVGAEHPFVIALLGAEQSPTATGNATPSATLGTTANATPSATANATPSTAAKKHLVGTMQHEVVARRALVDGGSLAVTQSTDPMIVLARNLYPLWREQQRFEQEHIVAVKEFAHDEIARLRFKLSGAAEAPDATGTLRVSFGRVAGFDREGIANSWATTFYGLYERSAVFGNKGDFALPARWIAARDKLKLATPFNFVTTLDIIGGSSGSPVINSVGELVGVIFDGNLDSLGNRFAYQEKNARALGVDVRAIVEALDKVYDAQALLRELTPHW